MATDQLHNTTDAREWAREFKRIWWDESPDLETMTAWFANAIQAGYDQGLRQRPDGPDPRVQGGGAIEEVS